MKPISQFRSAFRRASAIIILLLIAAIFPAQVSADPPSPLDPASGIARDTADLFWIVIGIGTVVFVIVNILLVYAIVRYRRRDEDELPVQIHGNSTLEIIWTVIPALIMIALFWLTFDLLREQRQAPAEAMVVEVIGHQWYWEFNYPETEVSILNQLVLPVNEPVQFEITSVDVIHSFWVPELAGKMDAIPGHTTTLWFEVDKTGTYVGQCAEFCGLEHYAMLFDVEAMPRDDFDAWMDEQIFLASQFTAVYEDPEQRLDIAELRLPTGDAATGEQLFIELGCNACHSLDGSQLVGPSQLGVGNRAGSEIDGYTAEEYLIESILRPCDYLQDGFTCAMPQDYGQRMEAQDLADVITYLLEQ